LQVEIIDPLFYEHPLKLGLASFVPTPDDYIAPWDCTNEDALFGKGKLDLDSFFSK
jgi:hypothetical protein